MPKICKTKYSLLACMPQLNKPEDLNFTNNPHDTLTSESFRNMFYFHR